MTWVQSICLCWLACAAISAEPAGPSAASPARTRPLQVVCGNAVVWDIARQIGGDRIRATSLVPPGADPHQFQPTAAEAKALAGADLVVLNGLGFEGWFEPLARESSYRGRVVVASAGCVARQLAAAHGHDHGHDHAHDDPHAWMDLANGQRYAENIRDALIAADPAGTADYRAWGDACAASLRTLNNWVKLQIALIPPERRVLVTNHDACGHFAAAYGFTIKAPVTALEDAQPSAKELAALVAWIRDQRVPAVFLEHAKNPQLVLRLAEEAGVRNGGELFLDTILAEGPSSYQGMFLLNVRRIVGALQ